ncbi:hypothetical protein FS837_011835 [Tulasnella sp. UAMH 9824]|nr:hypothetical protein FS837_011835 [Tulasnella sp. UAMH 9824]
MDEDTLTEDASHHAVADVDGLVGSDPSGSSDGFEPSTKLRGRVEKLAHWRIDPSSIDIWEGSECHGGHATVSGGEMEIPEMDMKTIEKRALSKKLVGKAKDDFVERQQRKRWAVNHFFSLQPKSLTGTPQDVAVKKMRLADDTDFERVLGLTIREAEFLAELDHPNIVELEGFVEDLSKGIIWLVFPWLYNGNLKEFVAKEKWEVPERISLISDVAKGLEYLHTRNPPVCHGDLKSLNVLIDSNAEAVIYAQITDFGSARRLPQNDPNMQIQETGTRLPSAQSPSAAFCASTKTVTLTGNKYTLRWAAPELLLQDQLSLWSDIWALGWIAYEVMTGSLPFEDAASEMAVVERVIEGKLPSLTDNAHLLFIHELCSLMNMCWNIRPTSRPTADICRRSIEKMPMLAPEMEDDERFLSYDSLRQLGHIYQSRGEDARAFTLFVESLDPVTGRLSPRDQIQVLRDLARQARLRREYSETISAYDVIWKICEMVDRWGDIDGLAGALYDLDELHQLSKENEMTGEPQYDGRGIEGQQRVARALCTLAEDHRRRRNHDEAIALNTYALTISTRISDKQGRAEALWGLAEAHRLRGECGEAISLYSEVLKIRTDLNDEEGRADALFGLADVHRRQDEHERAIKVYSEVLEIRTDLGDRQGRAEALWILADVHRLRSEYEKAIQAYSEYEKAIQAYSEVLETRTNFGDRKGTADALLALADTHRLRSEYDEAIRFYCDLLRMSDIFWFSFKRCRDMVLRDLADVHRLRRHRDEALPVSTNTLKFSTLLGTREGIVSILVELAKVHRLRDEYQEAISLYSEVLEIRTDLGDRKGRADALWILADVHRLRSEYEKAIQAYSEVLETRSNLGDRHGTADALLALADTHRRRSEYDEAIRFYCDLLRMSDIFWFSFKRCRDMVLRDLADVHRLQRHRDEAIPISINTLKFSTLLGTSEGIAGILAELAGVHRRRNECEEAIQVYSEVLEISTDLGDRKGIANALWGLADVHRLGGEYEEAIPLYYKALGIFTDIGDKYGKAAALLGLAAMRHRGGDDDGDDLCQLVAEIFEPSRRLTDPASDDERLLTLRIRVCKWLVGRLRSLASDLNNGMPTWAASDPEVSRQEAQIGSVDKSPSKIDAREGELLLAL